MAAYWRSPYKEHAATFRAPNHSTLRFEQSLHLSRAKTSISTSRYEWFDMPPRASADAPFSPRHRARSSTAIKSILKAPKRSDSSCLPTRDLEADTSEESTGGTTVESNSKKDVKKRVTFGIDVDNKNNDNNDNIDPENGEKRPSLGSSKRPKCASTTLKRITHSRQIEESALKRLNKLMGNGAAESPSLPSVKGKGISPSSAHNKLSKSLCSHSEDLQCIRCIRKDVENVVTNETFLGNQHMDVKFMIKGNQSSHLKASMKDKDDLHANCDHNLPDVNKENSNNNNVDSVYDSYADNSIEGKEETHSPRHNSIVNSTSNNAKKYYRLLPGRYPFSSGAIHIKKLTALPRRNEEDNVDSLQDISVIGVNKDKMNSQSSGKSLDDKNNRISVDSVQNLTSSSSMSINNYNRQTNSASRIHEKGQQYSSAVHVDSNSTPRKNETSGIRSNVPSMGNGDTMTIPAGVHTDNMSSSKASDIMNWLNDVHKKQSFPPHHTSLTNQTLA